MDVAEDELQSLYSWIDEIPLSRPKRNIARDFSDGVLMAEIVQHYFPKLVELHNYSSANGAQQKMYNWNTLNQKVFKRLGFTVSRQDCDAVVNCVAGSIERVLKLVKVKISKFRDDSMNTLPPQPLKYTEQAATQRPPAEAAYQPSSNYQPPPPNNNSTMQRSKPSQMSNNGGQQVYTQMVGSAFTSPLSFSPELLAEKDGTIGELRETNEILETKVRKLEQLVRLKDAKIQTLMAKLQGAGLA